MGQIWAMGPTDSLTRNLLFNGPIRDRHLRKWVACGLGKDIWLQSRHRKKEDLPPRRGVLSLTNEPISVTNREQMGNFPEVTGPLFEV